MSETQNIEWKTKWKDEYLEWICGFANAQGGKLYIGMDDDGKVVGLDNARKLMEDIPNKVRQTMGIVVDVNRQNMGNLSYIEIVIPPYPVAISYKGLYYYRSGSTMQTLSGVELESFILRKRGATWDNMPLPSFTADDIDDELVDHFKQMAVKKGRIDESVLSEPKEILMEKLRLTNAGYYTNAAMLLFNKRPDDWLLGAYTKIGFFETDADLLYQDEIHGSLLEQVDKIIEVIHLKYMKAKITYEGMQRIERYFVPDAALREALLNALCHKLYQSCIPIQVSIYDDRLYIANCGQLPENWTMENLMNKHASIPYNPSIANVYYLAGFIESWGRGIEKICLACDEDGSPRPEYTVHPGDIMIKFTAAEDRIIQTALNQVTEGVTEKVTEKVTENESTILSLLIEDPAYTYAALAEKLGISRKTVSARIRRLKEKGILQRIGSDTKGYWQINSSR
ncbi:MAG: putative DNA binding domain-containing protein [Roseburia sp.]|nr:putative DNA binding domain-containing protein [Roseburia sp.]MCM1097490.1 putative DNA binding domain-containing protein [Ruminococcus flavefaciens]